MTVAELIKKLQVYPSNYRVVTPGFDEASFDDVDTVELINICFQDSNTFGHCGRHDEDPVNGEESVLINF